MAQSYTRQSTFSDGDTITAALFNNEYNQLVNAFTYSSSSASSTGHRHDGTAGHGGNIHTIGDLDFLNKIVADSTNNRWGVFVEVSSAAVEQIRIQDGAIVPVTDNDIDLGTSSLEFKDAYFDGTITTDLLTVSGATNLDGAIQVDNTITVGVDDTGYDVKFFGDTASAYMLWDASADDLVLAGAAGLDVAGDIDVDGTSNLDNTDIDGTLAVDGTTISLDATTSLNIDNSNTSNGITIGTATSGVPVSIGHTTSEVTVNDNLTVTGTLTLGSGAELTEAELEMLDGITAGTVAASKAVVVDSNKDAASFRNITLTGELDAGSLDVSGDADIDGTLETDALSINGTAVTSTAAELNILDGVTSTAAELNILDGVTASATDINLIDGITNGTVIASKAIITDANKDISGGRNITISGELDAATLDISGDADIDGTLEADAITIGGTTLAETISDTVGAMVGSNTETGITVTYEDGDNTLDFVIGTLNQDTTGTADNITVSANNSADETVYPIFVDGATGSQGAESDTGLTYNPSSGVLTSTSFTGNLTGNVTGNTSGTAATVTGAAQSNITSLGTLTTLTVDNVIVNGTTIGHTSDTDLITLADGNVTIAGELDLTTLDVSGDADIDGTLEADAITVNGSSLASVIAGTTVANATLAATTTVTDSTANTNFPVVFHDESNALLDDTGALRYNPSTGELLVPKLTVAGVTTTADTVTMQASNAIIFEGATADSNETTLSIVDPTGDHTQYLINQGGYIPVLAAATTTAITSTPAELNILDGATVVVGEINALDLGSTAVGTAIASKAVILDSNKDYTGLRNLTITGELDAATLDISGDVDIDGTLETDNLTVGGSQGSDGQVLTSTGSGVAWESSSSGAVTAINNATANELVTIGSTTTELDAEANLVFDGTNLGIGTASPSTNLHVYSTADNAPHLLLENFQNADTDDAAVIELYLNDQTTGGIGDNTDVGVIRFTGDEKDGGTKETYAEIRGVAHDPGQGSANKGHLSFFVQAAGDLNETLTLDENMVGIGTTSPDCTLEVNGSANSEQVIITGTDNRGLSISTAANAGQNDAHVIFNAQDTGHADYPTMSFQTGGTERMRITSDGKVGIGTASPGALLDVGGGSIADPTILIDSASGGDPTLIFDTGAANRSALIKFKDQGTIHGFIDYKHNGDLMSFGSGSSTAVTATVGDGVFFVGATAAVDGERAAISKEGTCKLLIHCTEDSSARDAILSMHTRNGGSQCRINFADGAGAGTGSGQIYYNHDGNDLIFITDATEVGKFAGNGDFYTNDGTVHSLSDQRLKTNVEDYTYDMDVFKSYQTKMFDWINPEEHGNRSRQIGFIAQEQEAIDSRFVKELDISPDSADTALLDTITKEDGDVRGIGKTSEFNQKDAMYISVIQQLITRLETAEEKIAALEGGS